MPGLACIKGFLTTDSAIMEYLKDPAVKIIDASSESSFWSAHVEKAINVPSGGLFSDPRNASSSVLKSHHRLPKVKSTPLVVYSDWGLESQRIVKALRKCANYTRVINAGPMSRVNRLKRRIKEEEANASLLERDGLAKANKKALQDKWDREQASKKGAKKGSSDEEKEQARLDAIRNATLDLRTPVEMPRPSWTSTEEPPSVRSGEKE